MIIEVTDEEREVLYALVMQANIPARIAGVVAGLQTKLEPKVEPT